LGPRRPVRASRTRVHPSWLSQDRRGKASMVRHPPPPPISTLDAAPNKSYPAMVTKRSPTGQDQLLAYRSPTSPTTKPSVDGGLEPVHGPAFGRIRGPTMTRLPRPTGHLQGRLVFYQRAFRLTRGRRHRVIARCSPPGAGTMAARRGTYRSVIPSEACPWCGPGGRTPETGRTGGGKAFDPRPAWTFGDAA